MTPRAPDLINLPIVKIEDELGDGWYDRVYYRTTHGVVEVKRRTVTTWETKPGRNRPTYTNTKEYWVWEVFHYRREGEDDFPFQIWSQTAFVDHGEALKGGLEALFNAIKYGIADLDSWGNKDCEAEMRWLFFQEGPKHGPWLPTTKEEIPF